MVNERIRNAGKVLLFGSLFLAMLTVLSACVNPTKWFDDMRIQDRDSGVQPALVRQDPERLRAEGDPGHPVQSAVACQLQLGESQECGSAGRP